jgi:hypothetical protein
MVSNPETEAEYIPPDTVSSVKAEILPIVEAALREAGQEQLLTTGEFQIEVEKTFPTDLAVVAGLTFLSQIALETYKATVLPWLKKRFSVKEKRRRKTKGKK